MRGKELLRGNSYGALTIRWSPWDGYGFASVLHAASPLAAKALAPAVRVDNDPQTASIGQKVTSSCLKQYSVSEWAHVACRVHSTDIST